MSNEYDQHVVGLIKCDPGFESGLILVCRIATKKCSGAVGVSNFAEFYVNRPMVVD